MPTYRVHYMQRTSVMCYVEVEAGDEIAASNKAQELIVESDDPLVEMPETYETSTDELGEVTLVEEGEVESG